MNFVNKFILAVLMMSPKDKPDNSGLLPETWERMFEKIDEKTLADKEIKYLLPIAIVMCPTLRK